MVNTLEIFHEFFSTWVIFLIKYVTIIIAIKVEKTVSNKLSNVRTPTDFDFHKAESYLELYDALLSLEFSAIKWNSVIFNIPKIEGGDSVNDFFLKARGVPFKAPKMEHLDKMRENLKSLKRWTKAHEMAYKDVEWFYEEDMDEIHAQGFQLSKEHLIAPLIYLDADYIPHLTRYCKTCKEERPLAEFNDLICNVANTNKETKK